MAPKKRQNKKMHFKNEKTNKPKQSVQKKASKSEADEA